MSPRRIVRRRYWLVYFASALVVVAFGVAGWAYNHRSDLLDRVLYEQCVSNEQQDVVIVSILLSIPPERRSQVVRDAINALEPTDEQDCKPPKGAQP